MIHKCLCLLLILNIILFITSFVINNIYIGIITGLLPIILLPLIFMTDKLSKVKVIREQKISNNTIYSSFSGTIPNSKTSFNVGNVHRPTPKLVTYYTVKHYKELIRENKDYFKEDNITIILPKKYIEEEQ